VGQQVRIGRTWQPSLQGLRKHRGECVCARAFVCICVCSDGTSNLLQHMSPGLSALQVALIVALIACLGLGAFKPTRSIPNPSCYHDHMRPTTLGREVL
jgi:hypothetical protein